jgi:hypothetical protein
VLAAGGGTTARSSATNRPISSLVQSYRWRRRLAWSGSALALLVGIAAAAILLPKDHGKRYQLNATGTEPPQSYTPPPKEVRVTPQQRRAVNATLIAFVRTGVTRSDPAAAWALTTPEMRGGIKRTDWDNGDLPVLPFRANLGSVDDWTVINSYPGDLTVDLLLQPRAGSKTGPIAFAVELKQRKGRWLVDSMVPEQAFGPSGPTAAPKPLPKNFKGEEPKARLSPLYFIIPGALLGLIVLVPLSIALLGVVRARRIERRYRRDRL